MSREDFYHKHVKAALVAAGWTIIADPLTLAFYASRVLIDLAATRTETDGTTSVIAVEVKSFRQRGEYVNSFQKGLGQFLLYRDLLARDELPHQLFLAVPDAVYMDFFADQDVRKLVEEYKLKFITFNPETQRLVKWNP